MGRKRNLDAESMGYGPSSGWTVDILREHLERVLAERDLRYQQRFDAQSKALEAALLAAEKAVQTALIAAEKAVTKAEIATEKRLEGMNEFRGALADQAKDLVTRVELDAVVERMRELAARVDKTEGRSTGLSAGWGYLIAAAAVIIAIVSWLTR